MRDNQARRTATHVRTSVRMHTHASGPHSYAKSDLHENPLSWKQIWPECRDFPVSVGHRYRFKNLDIVP